MFGLSFAGRTWRRNEGHTLAGLTWQEGKGKEGACQCPREIRDRLVEMQEGQRGVWGVKFETTFLGNIVKYQKTIGF